MSNVIPHAIMNAITYPCPNTDAGLANLRQWGPWKQTFSLTSNCVWICICFGQTHTSSYSVPELGHNCHGVCCQPGTCRHKPSAVTVIEKLGYFSGYQQFPSSFWTGWRHSKWPTRYIENNVCTRVTNYFSAHERVILVFISRDAKQRGK